MKEIDFLKPNYNDSKTSQGLWWISWSSL